MNTSTIFSVKKGFATIVILIGILIIVSIAVGAYYFNKNYTSTSLFQENIDPQSYITIADTGSTNTPPWLLFIYKDGSGREILKPKPYQEANYPIKNKSFQKETFSKIISLVTTINDVSQIPVTSNCIKPASFASETTITFKGITSGDIVCLDGKAPQVYKDLSLEIDNIPVR